MNWKKELLDDELAQGNLHIKGRIDPITRLTTQNLIEIIDAVRNGIQDQQAITRQVTTLTFTQVKLPKNKINFIKFIQALLQIPHFQCLDLGIDSIFFQH